MRFKTSNLKEAKHSDLVSCVAWASPDDVISIGDDHKIQKWNLVSAETKLIAELPSDFHPTDTHWFPRGHHGAAGGGQGGKRGQTGGGQQNAANDVFFVTSAEGKLQLVNGKNGRLEKAVDAHRGACLSGKWSPDGAGIVTGGEDGAVKIWSRSVMLRSTLATNTAPVYAVAWSADSQSVLFATSNLLTIKALAPNSKPLQWKAHDSLILCADWSPSNGRIVSGGEDCRYRVWDSFGRQLYNAGQHDYPITAVSWSPDGQYFAVGSFNTLRLCDKIGWSHSLDKPATGSIFKIAWSADGTQVAGACGNGHVIFAHIIEKRFDWKDYEATVAGKKKSPMGVTLPSPIFYCNQDAKQSPWGTWQMMHGNNWNSETESFKQHLDMGIWSLPPLRNVTFIPPKIGTPPSSLIWKTDRYPWLHRLNVTSCSSKATQSCCTATRGDCFAVQDGPTCVRKLWQIWQSQSAPTPLASGIKPMRNRFICSMPPLGNH